MLYNHQPQSKDRLELSVHITPPHRCLHFSLSLKTGSSYLSISHHLTVVYTTVSVDADSIAALITSQFHCSMPVNFWRKRRNLLPHNLPLQRPIVSSQNYVRYMHSLCCSFVRNTASVNSLNSVLTLLKLLDLCVTWFPLNFICQETIHFEFDFFSIYIVAVGNRHIKSLFEFR